MQGVFFLSSSATRRIKITRCGRGSLGRAASECVEMLQARLWWPLHQPWLGRDQRSPGLSDGEAFQECIPGERGREKRERWVRGLCTCSSLLPILLPLHLLLGRCSALTACCVSPHLIALTETSLVPLYFGYPGDKTAEGPVKAAKAAN